MESNREDLMKSVDLKGKKPSEYMPSEHHYYIWSQWNHIRMILCKHWHVHTRSPILMETVGPRSLMVARRPHHLNDCLVRGNSLITAQLPAWSISYNSLVGSF